MPPPRHHPAPSARRLAKKPAKSVKKPAKVPTFAKKKAAAAAKKKLQAAIKAAAKAKAAAAAKAALAAVTYPTPAMAAQNYGDQVYGATFGQVCPHLVPNHHL